MVGLLARPARRLLGLVALLSLPGCSVPLIPVPGEDAGRMGPRVTRSDGGQDRPGLARKLVTGKEAPTTLLAPDGTRRRVTGRRFREVVEGEEVWCVWHKG